MNRTHYDTDAETRSNAGSSSSTTLPATASDDKEYKEQDNHITQTNNERTSDNNNNASGSQEKQADDTYHEEYEVKWDGLNDPENPKALKKSTKWFVTLVVSMGALCVLVLPLVSISTLIVA